VPTGGVLVMVAVKVTDVPLVLNVGLGETLVDVDVRWRLVNRQFRLNMDGCKVGGVQ
jgi:hypothetical protein